MVVITLRVMGAHHAPRDDYIEKLPCRRNIGKKRGVFTIAKKRTAFAFGKIVT